MAKHELLKEAMSLGITHDEKTVLAVLLANSQKCLGPAKGEHKGVRECRLPGEDVCRLGGLSIGRAMMAVASLAARGLITFRVWCECTGHGGELAGFLVYPCRFGNLKGEGTKA